MAVLGAWLVKERKGPAIVVGPRTSDKMKALRFHRKIPRTNSVILGQFLIN
jgi:hypothetical protein